MSSDNPMHIETLDRRLIAGMFVMSLPPVVLCVWQAVKGLAAPLNIAYLCLALFFFMVMLFAELPKMKSTATAETHIETGALSGLFTIFAVLYLPLVDVFWLRWFPVESNQLIFFLIGAALCLGGFVIRQSAFAALGWHFSHALRTTPDQEIISTGLYSRIRHPAYLGTLPIVPGLSLMLGSHIGVILLPLALGYIVKRISSEEDMLSAAFPGDYDLYKKRTNKLFPYIY